MKSAVLEELNSPLVIRESERPVTGPDEVLIHVKAAALNHRDLWIQKGLYPGIRLPVYPGSDGAGIVIETGSRVPPEWAGKEVIINPGHDWGVERAFNGSEFTILGLENPGTFSEYIKTDFRYLAEKPAHLSFAQAAAVPLAGVTAWRCLMTRAALAPGEKVLITGIGGGVALFAAQFALAAGAEVWVTSGSDEKIANAIALGVRGGVNYRESGWHRKLAEITGAGRKGYFNIIVDSAAGEGFRLLTDLAAPGGRLCIFGGTAGNISELLPARIFFKHLSILGSTMGSPEEFKEMISAVNQYKILPVIDSWFPFEKINEAMQRMEAGSQFGKIVLEF